MVIGARKDSISDSQSSENEALTVADEQAECRF